MGTRDVHIFIHRGRDNSETKHDPSNGQFAAGGSSGKKAEGGSEGGVHPHAHMHAIQERLYREKSRLKGAKTEKERKFREVQVAQAEKEITREKQFLEKKGTPYKQDEDLSDLSDDDLMRELTK